MPARARLYTVKPIITGKIRIAKYEKEFNVLLYKSLILVKFLSTINKFICLIILIIKNKAKPKSIII